MDQIFENTPKFPNLARFGDEWVVDQYEIRNKCEFGDRFVDYFSNAFIVGRRAYSTQINLEDKVKHRSTV